MINKLSVYSSIQTVPTITVTDSDPIEMDHVYVLNIDGLDPVQASINVMDSGAGDGGIPTGSRVGSRNIVVTLRPNPDWDTWTPEQLRQALYKYFTPKAEVNLVFTSEELGEVGIMGIVESCGANPFTKDPEYMVSIICPDPYFESLNLKTVTGNVSAPGSWADESARQEIIIDGTVEVGFKLTIQNGLDSDLIIQIGASLTSADPLSIFRINKDTTGKMVEICSIPGQRYVRLVDPDTGTFDYILDAITLDSVWPMLQPGDNAIGIMVSSDVSVSGCTWTLTYYERYGAI